MTVPVRYRSFVNAVGYVGRVRLTDRAWPEEWQVRPKATLALRVTYGITEHRTSSVRLELLNVRKTICHVLHYGFAAGISLIFSQNVVSAALRAFISL